MANADNMFQNSPVVSLPPVQPDQYFANDHYAGQSSHQAAKAMTAPYTPNASIPPTPGSIAGRKRSRGDVLAPDDDDVQPDGSLPTPGEEMPAHARGQPVTGPGMTLIYPDDPAYNLVAGTQSGTWVEGRDERSSFQLQHMKRPSVSSRKSQRMAATASDSDDLAQLVLPPQMRDATKEPLIDEATRVLGISWTRMDSTESLLISQAAYSKYIQNHYPSLRDVAVWFENSALPGYLVVALNVYTGQKEFHLFSHDLSEARLVTRDPNDLLPRLQLLPALHLAAPGGHIRAETDSASASQNEVNNVLQESAIRAGTLAPKLQNSSSEHERSAEPAYRDFEPLCTAHEMELD